jgi:hypothetical protein
VPPKKPLQAVPGTRNRPTHNARSKATDAALNGHELLRMIASGMSVTEAATALGVTPKRALELYREATRRLATENEELCDTAFILSLETYRLIKRAFMPGVLRGEYPAAKIVLACEDAFRDMLGLNAEIKVQVSNQVVDQTVNSIVSLLEQRDDELPQLLESDVLTIDPGEETTG